MTARTLEFFETYDLLLCPATIVAPFPIEQRYVAECAGEKFDNYVEWLASSMRSRWRAARRCRCPAASPATACRSGCRWSAPPRGEAQLLAGAKLLEDILGMRGSTPIDPRHPK